MSWRVWFTVAGVTHGQHGRTPVRALRKAIEFSLEQRPDWREWLDISAIEERLNAQGALNPDRTVTISTTVLASMGLVLEYPAAIQPNVLERTLRGASYLRRAEGLRSDRWRVTAATWEDFGREVKIAIHRGT